jgi:hypothetical protein
MIHNSTKGTHDWQYEMPEDEPGVPQTVATTLHGDSDYTITPGDPGCRYTRNGDGWPPSPAEVEFYNHRVLEIELTFTSPNGKEQIGLTLPVPKGNQKTLGDMFFDRLNLDTLTEEVLERESDRASDGPEYEPDCD